MDVDIKTGGSPDEVAAVQAEEAKIAAAKAQLTGEANILILGKYKDDLAEGTEPAMVESYA